MRRDPAMAHAFQHRRRVEFADTDLAGIVHFSNFFRFFEVTEHEFFRSLGLRLHGARDGRMFGWARVHASCDYFRPAHYLDVLEVSLTVREKTRSALRYDFVAHVVETADEGELAEPREIAKGRLEVVYVERGLGEERMRAAPMPPEVDRRLEAAPQ